jgi:predicted nucleotide-binding protein
MNVRKESIIESDELFKDITTDLLKLVNVTNNNDVKMPIKINMDKIFIVHGHDEQMKLDVARFIEKLGFGAIILHEQVNEGLTVIEKFEKFSDTGYGIVLYSPCDVGGKNEDNVDIKPRARQNVIFEHGYLIGKLGRNKVAALVEDNSIELPSDIDGILYIPYDDGNWKFRIAKELKNAGYAVDMNLIV